MEIGILMTIVGDAVAAVEMITIMVVADVLCVWVVLAVHIGVLVEAAMTLRNVFLNLYVTSVYVHEVKDVWLYKNTKRRFAHTRLSDI